MERIQIVDSHTGGEPTRLVLAGFPALGAPDMAGRLVELRDHHDRYRVACVGEPRSADIVVGALLTPPVSEGSVTGVIFFNNVGYLGMCGHGAIGVVTTLAWQGHIGPGTHRLDTPVGTVACELHTDGSVTVANVASYRARKDVAVEVPGYGPIVGDVSWGGNWFFLVKGYAGQIGHQQIGALTVFTAAVRTALEKAGVRGDDGAVVDHIEVFTVSPAQGCDSRSFVLCPGLAYDRSPCGTGTSAKLACLAADGELAPGKVWRQESVIGSVFEARYRWQPDSSTHILPTITGRAHICGEGRLILDTTDPFCWGIA